MKTSECIKKYRKLNKLTQKQLGDLIGKSAGAIRKYESGLRTPALETILFLAKALNVEPTELFGDDKESRYMYLAFIATNNKSYEPVAGELLKQKISNKEQDVSVALLALEVLYEHVNQKSILKKDQNKAVELFKNVCEFIKDTENK
jgi:transcriptional regulator with XRE-family HTH domain